MTARAAFREAMRATERDPLPCSVQSLRYLARLALEAREAEDHAVAARARLAEASVRLQRVRARVIGTGSEGGGHL